MRESVQLSIGEKNEIYKFAVAYFFPPIHQTKSVGMCQYKATQNELWGKALNRTSLFALNNYTTS